MRTQFADTARWRPVVVTDEKGKATLEITWPENLTAWRIRGCAVTGDTRILGLRTAGTRLSPALRPKSRLDVAPG